MWKHKKNHTTIINLKYQLQHGMIIWIDRSIIFCIRYSRLFWVNLKIAWRKYWWSLKKNICINGENVPYLEIAEVVLTHCTIVENGYQLVSRVLYTFFPNKSYGSLLEIAATNFKPFKTFNSKFSYIEVWFTDQNSQLLKIDDRINLNLVIKWYIYYKNALFN